MLRLVIVLMAITSFSLSAEYVEPSQNVVNEQKEHMRASINDADSLMKSEEFRDQLMNDREQINNITPSKNNFLDIPDLSINQANRDNRFLNPERTEALEPPKESFLNPMIFISFSMPDAELKLLMQEAKDIQAGVFIQGFIDDEFSKTYEKISSLVEETGVGIGIDPTLFERFDINVVPSFVLPFESVQQCSKAGCNTPEHVKAAGASLRYFLDYLVRNGNKQEEQLAKQWLRKE